MGMKHLAFALLLFNLAVVFSFVTKTTSEGGGYGDDYGHDQSGSSNDMSNFCPEAEELIFSRVQEAVMADSRMAASLLRLHFHDCFVNGCDGSVLLDDSVNFVGEKTAAPNLNSLRGFDVIDAIKSDLEAFCPETVSCADILAIAARDSVVLSGGPSWDVQMGRRDSFTASKSLAAKNLPGPASTVSNLVSKFQNLGLNLKDMVVLSGITRKLKELNHGAHTMGRARCTTFRARLQSTNTASTPGASLQFVQSLQKLCTGSSSNATLANLDLATPVTFDNQYYVNLLSGQGLLPSDQNLVTDSAQTRQLVETYAEDVNAFFEDFRNSMIKMGRFGMGNGMNGEIRRNCRAVN